MVEDGHEVIETPLPAVITVVKEINVPRLPSLRGITRSKRVEVPVWTAKDLGVDEGRVGLAGSATQVVEVFFPQRIHQGEMLKGEPDSQVDALIEKLRDLKIT
jgi:electron transfer flavoprotein beta subunit